MAANWTRPNNVPYPSVWLHENGIVIRDVTPDIEPYVIEHMLAHFAKDEPLNKSTRLYEDPLALEDLTRLWTDVMLPDRVSIVALADGTPGADLKPVGPNNPPKILGANMLGVAHKNDPPAKPVEESCKSASARLVFNTFMNIAKQVNVFDRFNVDHYLDAAGLSVCPSTRGKGLGVMLLRARIELCKRLRIPLTKTVFTAIQSQKISDKAGFQLVYEKNYEDYVQNGKLVFPDMAPTKTIQLKVHTIGK